MVCGDAAAAREHGSSVGSPEGHARAFMSISMESMTQSPLSADCVVGGAMEQTMLNHGRLSTADFRST